MLELIWALAACIMAQKQYCLKLMAQLNFAVFTSVCAFEAIKLFIKILWLFVKLLFVHVFF